MDDHEENISFKSFQLDTRLLRALEKHGFHYATPIQREAIPLALHGKDLLIRAKTGSGKTLVYLVPILDRLLHHEIVDKMVVGDDANANGIRGGNHERVNNDVETIMNNDDGGRNGPKVLILVPTRDLCEQVDEVVRKLISYCSRRIRCVTLNGDMTTSSHHLERARLVERPDLVISTPGRLLMYLQEGSDNAVDFKQSLRFLVIDEADLMFSFGYGEDVRCIVEKYLPRIFQSFLVSATLNTEIDQLKRWILHTPAILKLEEYEMTVNDEPSIIDTTTIKDDKGTNSNRMTMDIDGGNLRQRQLEQYSIIYEQEEDRYVMIYAIMKLKLVPGKTLFFVDHIEQAYRLKLFLEQFSIRSCVLNAELPHISRHHTIQEFNRGVHEYLIATDGAISADNAKPRTAKTSSSVQDPIHSNSIYENNGDEETINSLGEETTIDTSMEKSSAVHSKLSQKRRSKRTAAEIDYGLARGIDFQNVVNVINFDTPTSIDSYIHRIGRTARGKASGRAITFVLAKNREMFRCHIEEPFLASNPIRPFAFRMNEIEGFRYRVNDARRAITRVAIKEARWNDYRIELLNSEKLKAHFKQHPEDLHLLKHDKVLQHPARIQAHLKHIPDYLIPTDLSTSSSAHHGRGSSTVERIRPGVDSDSSKSRKLGSMAESSSKRRRLRKCRDDPLKNFRFSRPTSSGKVSS